jgi:hypothetical protein
MEAADSSEMPENLYQGAWCHPRTAVQNNVCSDTNKSYKMFNCI